MGCKHEDAKWLASLFTDGVPETSEEARTMFLEQSRDARAMYFSGCLGGRMDPENFNLVEKAAHLGYGPAQAFLAGWSCSERFEWAQKAAAQQDRDGLLLLASCYFGGIHACQKDVSKALLLYREAAELENPMAQWDYGQLA